MKYVFVLIGMLGIGMANAKETGLYLGIEGGVAHTRVKTDRAEADWETISEGFKSDLLHLFTKNKDVITVKLGYQRVGRIRSEIAYSHYGKIDNNHYVGPTDKSVSASFKRQINSSTVMLNLYYEMDTGSAAALYVMGGIGVASNRLKNYFDELKVSGSYDFFTTTQSRTRFAWQVGSGVSYAFMPNLVGDIGIKYTDRGMVDFNNTIVKDRQVGYKVRLTSVEGTVGLRYMF